MIRKVVNTIDESVEDKVLNPIEYWLWKFRYISLLAVFFCALASVALFIIGTIEILSPIKEIILSLFFSGTINEGLTTDEILKEFIGALDLYLTGVFFLIFSFGLYELIISKIDVAREDDGDTVHPLLQISSLDELKSKIIKVIIIILIVGFFKNVISMKMSEMIDTLILAIAILALCIGSYFLTKEH